MGADLKNEKLFREFESIAEMEGFEKGSERHEKRIRQLKVVKCRELRGHSACTECNVFDHCEMVKQVMRDHRGY